ncbi:MAG: RluA family pseudouridine synthase [bacterium]|nr:RluA family pseudouridine synthase [bacterium]
MKIKILYEDKDILVIDKPSGIAVHPDGKTKEKTITDWVLKNYPRMKNVGEPLGEIARPGVVHRLDKETSGVLLLAKNQKAYEFLKEQFQERSVKKIYFAIVSGSVKEERGFIKKPIGRSPNDFRKWLAGRGARGELREAETFFKVLKRIKKDFTVLEVRPKTGRTHQIRVHMKYLNHPVVGDDLYNRGKPRPKGINRLALHAKSIEFKNLKGDFLKIESPLPKEFEKVLK